MLGKASEVGKLEDTCRVPVTIPVGKLEVGKPAQTAVLELTCCFKGFNVLGPCNVLQGLQRASTYFLGFNDFFNELQRASGASTCLSGVSTCLNVVS